MITQKKEDTIFCPYCKQWVPYTHVCTYHRWLSVVWVVVILLTTLGLVANRPSHAIAIPPTTPTVGEPVSWPNDVYLPILMR